LPDQADVKITWLNNCDITVDTCTDDCTFTGSAADSSVQTLQIDQCKQSTFSEPIDAWRGNLFGLADAIAVNLNKIQKAHAEAAAQHVISVLNTNAGTNAYDNNGEFSISGTETEIPDWTTTKIFGKLRRLATKNYIANPYIIDGSNLDQLVWEARSAAGNADGRGDANRVNEMPIYVDLFNVDAVNTDKWVTYLLNRGAVAFASKAYFGATAEVLGGATTRISVSNRFFPMLKHDIEFVEQCTGGVWSVHYRVKSRYQAFVNPTGCTATRTGILKLINPGGV
jgi:hypothetical protein